MAIRVTPDNSDPNDPKMNLVINNGDLEGLNRIMNKYRFVDQQAALRFAMVTLLDAEDNKVYVRKGGVTTVLQPNDNLLKKPDDSKATSDDGAR